MKWGIVSTIKAQNAEIEAFAAYHLELGAHRLFIYLDDENEAAFQSLKQHPKIRVFRTHGDHWRSKNRPVKHQARQTANASHAYRRKAQDVDWLAHIDVDEFLMPQRPLSEQLGALQETCQTARVRPVEALASDEENLTYFKAMTNDRKLRLAQSEQLFPTFGQYLNGGFLSHVAGKIFLRTGLENVTFKIHNAYVSDAENPGQEELSGTELCHLHAQTLGAFKKAYEFRLKKGVYRAEMKPNKPHEQGGLNLHQLFTMLGAEGQLDAFYEEVCTATPELKARLDALGLLRAYRLDLAAKRARHFPAK